MPAPFTSPPARPHSVRTAPPPSLLGSPCPVCASKVGSYAEDLRHEQTALLAFENTPAAWPAALTRLVDDADLRADLSARGLGGDADDRLDRPALGEALERGVTPLARRAAQPGDLRRLSPA
jgi:hypothetical protein